jgi:hypothetical protein
VPGEPASSRQYGFRLTEDFAVVVSIVPNELGMPEVEWTPLRRLRDRDRGGDIYAPGTGQLSVEDAQRLPVLLAATLEHDIENMSRPAHSYIPARPTLMKIYERPRGLATSTFIAECCRVPQPKDTSIMKRMKVSSISSETGQPSTGQEASSRQARPQTLREGATLERQTQTPSSRASGPVNHLPGLTEEMAQEILDRMDD